MRHRVELFLQIRKLRAALAGAGRIAGLRHEAVDHAVEDHAVVEAFASKGFHSLDMVGCPTRHQTDRDTLTIRQVEQQDVLAVVLDIVVDLFVDRLRRGRFGRILGLRGDRAQRQSAESAQGGGDLQHRISIVIVWGSEAAVTGARCRFNE